MPEIPAIGRRYADFSDIRLHVRIVPCALRGAPARLVSGQLGENSRMITC
jgi:hypothetical protein